MKLKKRQLKLLFLIALCVFAYMTWSVQRGEAASVRPLCNDDFIRFHVIANSDAKEDQELKLKVRDGLLVMINTDLTNPAFTHMAGKSAAVGGGAITEQSTLLNINTAREYIRSNLPRMEQEAKRIIRENGYDYKVKASLGVRWVPEKTYGNLTFPPGYYEALNVIIGTGGGQNWWCVLFPPLCLIDPDSPKAAAEVYEETDAAKQFASCGLNVDGIYSRALLDERYEGLMKDALDKSHQTTLRLEFKSVELLKNR